MSPSSGGWEFQDQRAGRFTSCWGSSPWLADGHLLTVPSWGGEKEKEDGSSLMSLIIKALFPLWSLPVAQTVKNPPVMQEMQVWSLGQEDPLEKGMATHCSILAWRIPWTEEVGGLQSVGSQRVRHDLSDWARTFPSWRPHLETSTKPNYLPNGPSPDAFTLGVRVLHMNGGRGSHNSVNNIQLLTPTPQFINFSYAEYIYSISIALKALTSIKSKA